MARLENNIIAGESERMAGMQKEIDKLKSEVKKKKSRSFLSCRNIFLFVLLLIVVAVMYLAYVLALTGIVTVPYFSKKYFITPEPIYTVKATGQTTQEEEILNLIKKQFLAQPTVLYKLKNKEKTEAKIELSDTQLTDWFRQVLVTDNQLADLAQVAINREMLQFFIVTKGQRLYFTVNVLPQVKEGNLAWEIRESKIGNLQLPNVVSAVVLKKIVFDNLTKLINFAFKDLVIKNIELVDQKVIFSLELTQLPDAY